MFSSEKKDGKERVSHPEESLFIYEGNKYERSNKGLSRDGSIERPITDSGHVPRPSQLNIINLLFRKYE